MFDILISTMCIPPQFACHDPCMAVRPWESRWCTCREVNNTHTKLHWNNFKVSCHPLFFINILWNWFYIQLVTRKTAQDRKTCCLAKVSTTLEHIFWHGRICGFPHFFKQLKIWSLVYTEFRSDLLVVWFCQQISPTPQELPPSFWLLHISMFSLCNLLVLMDSHVLVSLNFFPNES